MINPFLQITLGMALALGIFGTIAFYLHLLLGQFNPWLMPLIILGILVLGFINRKHFAFLKRTPFTWQYADSVGLGLLALLSFPLIMEANYYPLGGWDAWSCWNLKAKFIFLGQEHWRDMFDPALWRSNTQYPLLLPLINVFFWNITGDATQIVPMTTSIAITLLSAAVLYWSLLALSGRAWLSALCTALPFSLSFIITLSVSQYSDALLGLYFLCAVACLLLAEHKNIPALNLLAALFIGLLSFTKTEGTLLAGILSVVYIGREFLKTHSLKKLLPWIYCLIAASLPTIIFTLFMAPKNEAFINGLFSGDKPSDLARLQMIAVFPFFEMISSKWNGLWVIALASIIAAGKGAWDKKLLWIPLTLGLYLGAILAYYWINTFFPIGWWLQNTLSRILFAIIPTLFLWIGISFRK